MCQKSSACVAACQLVAALEIIDSAITHYLATNHIWATDRLSPHWNCENCPKVPGATTEISGAGGESYKLVPLAADW
jgi:hypothetical protein